MKLRQGDVYLDRDKQLVIVVQDYSTKNLYLISFHHLSAEFLSFSSTLGTEQAITAHLNLGSKFLFNLAGPFAEILRLVLDET